MSVFEYPVSWPAGWQRATKQVQPPFKANWSTTMDEMKRALVALQCEYTTITSNIPIRMDGRPNMQALHKVDDPAVAVYFTRNGQEVCIPCDRFATAEGNLRAIGLTLEYMRRMKTYGTSEMVDAAFRGFTALPAGIPLPGPDTAKPWHEVLQVAQNADEAIIRAAYRNLAARYHPDNRTTGDATRFAEVQKAYEHAMPWKESWAE